MSNTYNECVVPTVYVKSLKVNSAQIITVNNEYTRALPKNKRHRAAQLVFTVAYSLQLE